MLEVGAGALLSSMLIAIVSIVLSRYVDYVAYLPLFNAMALAMLVLVLVGLSLSVYRRGREIRRKVNSG